MSCGMGGPLPSPIVLTTGYRLGSVLQAVDTAYFILGIFYLIILFCMRCISLLLYLTQIRSSATWKNCVLQVQEFRGGFFLFCIRVGISISEITVVSLEALNLA